ncbi:phage tail spike protein [Paenibacillus ehimensis]|uniref:phage tail spike protein n=1 Tax=Paenibacillus ehimensis TaxID=79264 RepID=UPI002DBEA37A|nr:phage tail spike protein [Paenibacillus ehimensis]MEC0210246.1 phage tail spike protein [Paenibacillus ehimensis]
MLSTLGEFDPFKKPIEPQIFLAKPNREIIAKISESYNIKFRDLILQLNDISFDIPYVVPFNDKFVSNKNVELIKERYLLKVVRGSKVEWFTITKINDNMDEDKDYMSLEATSLGYQLRSRLLKKYHNDSAHAKTVLTEVLTDTNWKIDYIDADFQLTYREFDFQDTNVLDAVFKITETYNAILLWNTVNRTISLVKPELFGVNKGLKFSYGHYLRTLGKESNSDEMVTRLRAYGKDGLSIQNVNPTGQPYIENFSYFMFPFERDVNRNVIKHSEYMSDSLCHALLDYTQLIESKKSEFSTLLGNKESLQKTRTTKENELKTLQKQEAAVDNIVTLQQADKNMWFYKYNHNGSTVLNTTKLNPLNAYVLMIKVADTNNLTIKLNGIVSNVVAGKWVVIGKVKFSNFESIESSGSSNSEVYIQIANITDEENTTSNNEAALIEKYCIDNKKMQIAAKKNEIDLLNNQIKVVEDNISALRKLMAVENNFTSQQLQELNDYILEKTFSDEKYIDEKDLFKDAKEKFIELQKPQTVIKLSVVDFLRIIEEQHNWDKLLLGLGDTVTIEYEKIGVKVTARLIGIEYDYENFDINLTIANVKEITDDRKLFEKYIYNSNYTSTVVSGSKDRWGQAVKDSSEISKLFENFWNKVTNEVNFASNEYCYMDRKGLTIVDPNDPLRFLRATHGALAITRSGGLRYETTLTADGLIAEVVLGKLILGERVTIGDPDGIWLTEGPKTTITDRCKRVAMILGLYDKNPDKYGVIVNRYESKDCGNTNLINRSRMDSEDGFAIERWTGSKWDKTAWLDMEGYLNARGIKIDYMSGVLNNGIILDNTDGLVITRNDNQVRTRLNATEGFSIERFENNKWTKKFFADINGQFYSNDLIARRLRIVNDLDDLLLDANTNYMNIGRFENIITDGKLTAVEKLTLKQEWETIQTEYQKLKYQAEQYEYSDRDQRTVSHINIPPFVDAFVALGNYVNPLLADMAATTPVDRNEFKTKFQNYYDQAKRIINEITNALKYSSLLLGVEYNKVTIDAKTGILVEKVGGNVPVRTIMNATTGISIERYLGGSWNKRFWVDTDGVIQGIGLNIVDTNITNVTGQLTNGIKIDPQNGIVINRSDGRVSVHLDTINGIAIKNGGIDKFVVTPQGHLYAEDMETKRLLVKGNQGEILLDANKKLLDFGKFDMLIGSVAAENISTQVITALEGTINDLTVNKLKTLGLVNEGDYTNYIFARENKISWITGQKVSGSGEHAKNSLGQLLYWKDVSKTMTTTEVTPYPAMKYAYFEDTKMEMFFEGTGVASYPRIRMGAGDGILPESGRAYLNKPNGSLEMVYYRSNDAKERSVYFKDSGIFVKSQEEKINIECNNFNLAADNGKIYLELNNGSYFELSSTSLKTNIQGDIELKASGKITLSGSQIHFNA